MHSVDYPRLEEPTHGRHFHVQERLNTYKWLSYCNKILLQYSARFDLKIKSRKNVLHLSVEKGANFVLYFIVYFFRDLFNSI